MGRRRRLIKNTTVSFVSNIGNKFISFIGSIIFARLAGESSLGVYFTFMSAYQILSIISSLGIGQALVKRVSEYSGEEEHKKTRQFVATSLTAQVIIVSIVGTVLYIGRTRFDQYVGMDMSAFLMISLLGIMIFFGTYRQVLTGYNRVDIASLTDVARNTLIVGIQIALVIAGLNATGLIGGVIVGSTAAAAISFALSPAKAPRKPTRDEVASLLRFSWFSYLDSFFGTRRRWYDILILRLFVASGPIGVYGIVNSLSQFGYSLSSAMGKSIFPEISQLSEVEERGESTEIVKYTMRYSTILSIPLFFGVISTGDLVLLYVYEFEFGVITLVTLAAGGVAFSIYGPIHQILYGLNAPKASFKISSSTTILNVLLALLLAPFYGILGAAIATSIAMVTATILGMYVLENRMASLSIVHPRYWGYQLASGLFMSFILVATRFVFVLQSLAATVLLVFIGAIIYGLSLFMLDGTLRNRVRQRVAGLI